MKAKIVLVIAALMASPGISLAEPEPQAAVCMLANVAGTYGFSGSGTILPVNDMGLPPGPVTFAGLLVLEANGQFSGRETISFNGNVTSGVLYSGTYTVNADCTITLVSPGFFHNEGVFVAGRKELMLMLSDNGVLISFTAKRI
jgi:hypothetical protein